MDLQVYKDKITEAESALGCSLEPGEKADLLLDNFSDIRDSAEAHKIIDAIGEDKEYIFTFGNGYTLRHCYVVIKAPHEGRARHIMAEHYGLHWSCCYLSRDDAGVDKYNLTEVELGTPNRRL